MKSGGTCRYASWFRPPQEPPGRINKQGRKGDSEEIGPRTRASVDRCWRPPIRRGEARGSCRKQTGFETVRIAGESPIRRLHPGGGESDAEHVLMHGVPVQFLVAHNALAEEAIATASTLDYAGERVRVIGPEHLAALAFQAGGARRR